MNNAQLTPMNNTIKLESFSASAITETVKIKTVSYGMMGQQTYEGVEVDDNSETG